jgi:hypothetical protein
VFNESEHITEIELLAFPKKTTNIVASHQYVASKIDMSCIKNIVWDFFDDTYKRSGLKFLSFDDIDDMVDSSVLWKFTYEGKLENFNNIDPNNIIIIAAYKSKFGLKRVATGTRGNPYSKLSEPEKYFEENRKRNSAYIKHMKQDFIKAWCEVSHKQEKKLLSIGGNKYIIDPKILIKNKIFGAKTNLITIDEDNIHYTRTLGNGVSVTKIAIGNVDVH